MISEEICLSCFDDARNLLLMKVWADLDDMERYKTQQVFRNFSNSEFSIPSGVASEEIYLSCFDDGAKLLLMKVWVELDYMDRYKTPQVFRYFSNSQFWIQSTPTLSGLFL